jgi:hypothetical protein
MNKILALPVFVVACFACSHPSTVIAQDSKEKSYLIPLEREDKVGDKVAWKITGATSQKQIVHVNGERMQEEKVDITGSLEGTFETMAVSEKGNIMKYRILVDKLTMKEGAGEEQTILKDGAELIAEQKGEKAVYLVGGEDADETVIKLLEVMIDLSDIESQVSDDVAFGTDEPHKVGEEWDVRPAEIMKSMPKDMPFKIDEKGISGTMKFLAVKEHQGQQCAEVTSTINIKPGKMKDLPVELKLSKNNIKVQLTGTLPLDKTQPPVVQKESLQMDIQGSAEGPGGEMTMQISHSQSREMTRK